MPGGAFSRRRARPSRSSTSSTPSSSRRSTSPTCARRSASRSAWIWSRARPRRCRSGCSPRWRSGAKSSATTASSPISLRLAILDDYQRLALASADWERLRRRGIDVSVFHEAFASKEDAASKLASFDILVLMRERTAFGRELIERLPSLKFIALTGMRAPSLDVAACTARRIPISNTGPGRSTAITAETAWGLILAAARDFAAAERNMRAGRWHEGLRGGTILEGKRLGVLGLGKLGTRIASYARAFAMEVVAWSQNLTAARATEAGARLVSKEELLRTSDFVTLHLVLSERTRGMIGAAEPGLMKPKAVLVNTSRGPIVDEAALLA